MEVYLPRQLLDQASAEDRIAFARWLLSLGAITRAEVLDAIEAGPDWEEDWQAFERWRRGDESE